MVKYAPIYNRAERIAAARIAGFVANKAGRYAGRKAGQYMRKRKTPTTKDVYRIAKKAATDNLETNIDSIEVKNETQVWSPGTLAWSNPLSIPVGDESSSGNKAREGYRIRLSGIRLEYCIKSQRGGGNAVRSIVRMCLVKDSFDLNNATPTDQMMFSGAGEGTFADRALNFGQITPECTRIWRPLNEKRYKVLFNKRIEVCPNFAADDVFITDKDYVNMRGLIVKYGKLNTTDYNIPNIKLLYWYEQPNGTVDTTLKLDLKIKVYFKNL